MTEVMILCLTLVAIVAIGASQNVANKALSVLTSVFSDWKRRKGSK